METQDAPDGHLAKSITYGTGVELANACTPCLQAEETRIESIVFCQECSEFLCSTCRHQHRKLNLTRGHHLVMTGSGNEVSSDDVSMTEYCSEHPGKCIEYFCEDDHSFCCKSCIDVSHKGCEGVRYIPAESIGIAESEEIANAAELLQNIKTKLDSHITIKKAQTMHQADQSVVALVQIKTERNGIIQLINKLADEAERDIKAKGKIRTDQIKNELDTCESIMETLRVTDNSLKAVNATSGEPQIYITVKKADQQLRKYSSYVDEAEATTTEVNFQFVLDSEFYSIPEKLTTMGTLSAGNLDEENTLTRQIPSPSHSSTAYSTPYKENDMTRQIPSPSNSSTASSSPTSNMYCGSRLRKKASPVGGHSVRILGDKTTCYITGSSFLKNGQLVLADYNNRSVKLFSKNCNYLTHVIVSSRPNDIVVTGETEVATSLIDESAIQFISVDSLLSLSRRIKTSYSYVGLAYSKRRELYGSTTFENGTGGIHILDMSGNILRSIKEFHNQSVLIRPTTIHINDEGTRLYVNDLGRNSVVCLDLSKETTSENGLVFMYTDRNLVLRNGITTDRVGNVYVSSGNMTIHQISAIGSKVHEILTTADGLGLPHCLAFSPTDNNLLVSEFKENSFKLFALR